MTFKPIIKPCEDCRRPYRAGHVREIRCDQCKEEHKAINGALYYENYENAMDESYSDPLTRLHEIIGD